MNVLPYVDPAVDVEPPLSQQIDYIDSADVAPDGSVWLGSGAVIYKSLDDGATRTAKYTIPGSPTAIKMIYCAANGYIFASPTVGTSYGLWRSVDNGDTWTKVLTTDTNTCIWGIDEDADGNLYIGEYSWSNAGKMQIWKSTDHGDNWTQKYTNDLGPTSQDHIHDIRVDPSNGYIYASEGDPTTIHLLRSKDGGDTWTVINGISHQLLAFAFAGGRVYVGTDNPPTIGKIYWFTDDGSDTLVFNNAVTFPDAMASDSFMAGSYNGRVFFGTTSEFLKGNAIVIGNGDSWSYLYRYAHRGSFSGFQSVSRHDHNGKFFVSLVGATYGFWFTPA